MLHFGHFFTDNNVWQKIITSKTDCYNYNKFLSSLELESLKQLADTIYPSGNIYLDAERDEKYRELESIKV